MAVASLGIGTTEDTGHATPPDWTRLFALSCQVEHDPPPPLSPPPPPQGDRSAKTHPPPTKHRAVPTVTRLPSRTKTTSGNTHLANKHAPMPKPTPAPAHRDTPPPPHCIPRLPFPVVLRRALGAAASLGVDVSLERINCVSVRGRALAMMRLPSPGISASERRDDTQINTGVVCYGHVLRAHARPWS